MPLLPRLSAPPPEADDPEESVPPAERPGGGDERPARVPAAGVARARRVRPVRAQHAGGDGARGVLAAGAGRAVQDLDLKGKGGEGIFFKAGSAREVEVHPIQYHAWKEIKEVQAELHLKSEKKLTIVRTRLKGEKNPISSHQHVLHIAHCQSITKARSEKVSARVQKFYFPHRLTSTSSTFVSADDCLPVCVLPQPAMVERKPSWRRKEAAEGEEGRGRQAGRITVEKAMDI